MNSQETELYNRIEAFSFDQPNASLPFSKRLARDNGWSWEYAQRVIEEYKNFVFLAVAAGHPVTPSDQVDQVWHLHLSYTRSYWEDFCPHVLQMPLHHEPTRGGQAENQKFDDWYSQTLESYERLLEQAAPPDIWPAPEVRFGRDLDFVRINTQQNWVVPKLPVQRGLTASLVSVWALILGGCYAGNSIGDINPIAGILLMLLCVSAGFSLTRFVTGIVDFLKNPKAPRMGGGCSNSGYVGCGWGTASSHHGSSDSGSCGDSGGDCGNGCGSGGCGGGGCGSG